MPASSDATPPAGARSPLERAMRLERLTAAWNSLEVVVTIGLGIAAGSVALVAFGLDSLVEIFASLVVLWHLRGDGTAHPTRRAMRLVAIAFFALAAILLAGAVENLVSGDEADRSIVGILFLGLTVVVMFSLAWRKRLVSADLENHPLEHEARITFLDGMLATGVLVALLLNAVFGLWWADPLAAAAVGLAAIPEGLDAWGDSRHWGDDDGDHPPP